MQGIWALLVVWGCAGAAALAGARVLRSQREGADVWRERFAGEQRLFACGRLAAYGRNLADAAALAARLAPADAAAFERARSAAWDAAAAVAVDLPDDDGGCRAGDAEGFAVGLHQQHNPRLPPDWPNWVARVSWQPGR